MFDFLLLTLADKQENCSEKNDGLEKEELEGMQALRGVQAHLYSRLREGIKWGSAMRAATSRDFSPSLAATQSDLVCLFQSTQILFVCAAYHTVALLISTVWCFLRPCVCSL